MCSHSVKHLLSVYYLPDTTRIKTGKIGLLALQELKDWNLRRNSRLEFRWREFFFWFWFLAMPHGMRYLSSPTRDRTRAPLQWKSRILTTGPPGKSLKWILKKFLSISFSHPTTWIWTQIKLNTNVLFWCYKILYSYKNIRFIHSFNK